MVLFDISSEGSCERVTRVSSYAPRWNVMVSFYVRADRINYFLSLQIESGFVLRRRESYFLRSGIIPQTAGELLPPLGHISSCQHQTTFAATA
jgi:hypothetical protein